jgi:hypothetical protein
MATKIISSKPTGKIRRYIHTELKKRRELSERQKAERIAFLYKELGYDRLTFLTQTLIN